MLPVTRYSPNSTMRTFGCKALAFVMAFCICALFLRMNMLVCLSSFELLLTKKIIAWVLRTNKIILNTDAKNLL